MAWSQTFDFGSNWRSFSTTSLTPAGLEAAVRSLQDLMGSDGLSGCSFLDIGSGSGLFSIAAESLGASPIVAVDVNPECVAVARDNAARFRSPGASPEFSVASILDPGAPFQGATYDVVYAWGSLHHTGEMWLAIRNACARVAPGGRIVLAIYNKHASSPAWWYVKRAYNRFPGWLQSLTIAIFFGVIYAAKWLVTRRNPMRKARGMDFLHDVVDWVGGYPYEYASREEVVSFVEGLGLHAARVIAPEVPTGCNEFVFERPA